MTAERPTWKVEDLTLSGSFPARSIDPDAAMEAALAYKISHDRLNDVTALVKAAMGYFIEASQDALVELACKATAGSLCAPDGWELEVLPQRNGQSADLLLRSAVAGGWHIGLRTAKEFTGAAHARLEELNQEIDRDLDAQGLTGKEKILRRIFPKGDLTPAEKAYAALEADPESYRGLQPGDRFSRLTMNAFTLKGPPAGVEDFSRLDEILKADPDKDYLYGNHVQAVPELSLSDERRELLSSNSLNIVHGSAEVALLLLSRLLSENGLADIVKARSDELSLKGWRCYDSSPGGAEIMDAATAAVYRSGGLFDERVLERVSRFSRGIAAHDVNLRVPDFMSLAAGLVKHGYTSPERQFEANDGKHVGYAREEVFGFSVEVKTQRGMYRVDLHIEDGEMMRICAFRESGGVARPVGRFVRGADGFEEDYAGRRTGEPAVAYHISKVMDMNGIIAALSTLSCVLDMEYPEAEAGDLPAP